MKFGLPVNVAIAAILAAGVSGCGPAEIETSGGPAGMRRLTEQQYRNSIADIFGPDIQIAGRFDPITRPEQGLLAAGTSDISVSPAGFEQFYTMANSIAAQVMDEKRRNSFVACTPRAADSPDNECSKRFFGRIGRLVFRRPLTEAEIQTRVIAAHDATELTNNFYYGLALGLGSLLSSPNFIFDIDITEPDPENPGERRLSSYSKASRLSFFLWNTTPDLDLLAAAKRGDLRDKNGLTKQVDRLMASPRIRETVRTFFSDMLEFELIPNIVKDSVIYPKFVRTIKADMPEQTLRTITGLTLDENGDYRDLFTTRKTFLTRDLGVIYGIPVVQNEGWMPYEFPESEPRAGILTLMNFLAVFSHDGRSSPTLRGKALRERILCQPIPIPPGDVDFNIVQDTSNPLYKTARGRLEAHRTNPTCAGCHRITDPIGLGLENFDSIGVFRAIENGEPIDSSGDLDGVPFANAIGLGQAVHDNPATASCLTNRLFEYAVRRPVAYGERNWLQVLTERFADDGYRIPNLIRRIATSSAFFKISQDADQLSKEASL